MVKVVPPKRKKQVFRLAFVLARVDRNDAKSFFEISVFFYNSRFSFGLQLSISYDLPTTCKQKRTPYKARNQKKYDMWSPVYWGVIIVRYKSIFINSQFFDIFYER